MFTLLTGATGYVGGRLLPALVGAGRRVRCLARRPEFLVDRVGPGGEVVAGDVFDYASLRRAMEGIEAAFYLVHSMAGREDFVARDAVAAQNFARAARDAGVRRIVYLGGLGSGDNLSPHLASRHEVGEILRRSGVPTLEFRASVVLGSGSLSYEMIRALTEKLPLMITPAWTRVAAQPIAIEDLIAYLCASLDLPLTESRVVEVGSADRVSYMELMQIYGQLRGLKRVFWPVPFLTPRLSSYWLGLVTPLYAQVGRKLIDSIRHPTVVEDQSARTLFPQIEPMSVERAIRRAMVNEDEEFARTRWNDSSSAAPAPRRFGGECRGTRLIDSRSIEVEVSPEQAFAPIERIGGRNGWYFGDWLWRLRGALDLLAGGVGFRRGRRHPHHLRAGDPLDFWRVEEVERPHLLRLSAEMRLPGRAWLQFEVRPTERGSEIRQTAIFDARGLAGRLYWYGIYPLHNLIFANMLRGIAAAGTGQRAAGDVPSLPGRIVADRQEERKRLALH